MLEIELRKTMQIPIDGKELSMESVENRHERYLRNLIAAGFEPIYIGDTVKVSDRWAGNGENPLKGKTGEVTDIIMGPQAAFNIDYLIYRFKNPDNNFEMWYYTLDLVNQTQSNKTLVKILKETNTQYGRKI